MAKVNKTISSSREATTYVYRFLSMGQLNVAFEILKKMVKSAGSEYRESIGYIVLEIVKQLKNKPNVSQEIEHVFEVNLYTYI